VRSDRIQDTLRDLRAGGVVEENEILALHERRKISAEIFDRNSEIKSYPPLLRRN
jgi:hypothetical protein